MPEIAEFGEHVSGVLRRVLGTELTGVYFVGSVALGGFVPAELLAAVAARLGHAAQQ